MAIIWRPDTCACKFELSPDGESGIQLEACGLHASFETCLADNQLKNIVIKEHDKALETALGELGVKLVETRTKDGVETVIKETVVPDAAVREGIKQVAVDFTKEVPEFTLTGYTEEELLIIDKLQYSEAVAKPVIVKDDTGRVIGEGKADTGKIEQPVIEG